MVNADALAAPPETPAHREGDLVRDRHDPGSQDRDQPHPGWVAAHNRADAANELARPVAGDRISGQRDQAVADDRQSAESPRWRASAGDLLQRACRLVHRCVPHGDDSPGHELNPAPGRHAEAGQANASKFIRGALPAWLRSASHHALICRDKSYPLASQRPQNWVIRTQDAPRCHKSRSSVFGAPSVRRAGLTPRDPLNTPAWRAKPPIWREA